VCALRVRQKRETGEHRGGCVYLRTLFAETACTLFAATRAIRLSVASRNIPAGGVRAPAGGARAACALERSSARRPACRYRHAWRATV